MSEVKFTKGDWVVYDGDLRYCKGKVCIIEPDDMPAVIADLNNYFGEEARDANAHLIAAAPRMYEFIEMVAKGDGADIQALQYMAVTWVKNAEKILAKARGE